MSESADSGIELSVSGQYLPEMTPVMEHEEEDYEESSSKQYYCKPTFFAAIYFLDFIFI